MGACEWQSADVARIFPKRLKLIGIFEDMECICVSGRQCRYLQIWQAFLVKSRQLNYMGPSLPVRDGLEIDRMLVCRAAQSFDSFTLDNFNNQTRSCGDASAEAPEKISWWMGARTRCLKCPDEVNPGSAISCVRGHAKSASDDGSVAGDTR